MKLCGKPIIYYSLKALERSRYVNDIIVVVNKRDIKRAGLLARNYSINKIARIVEGGEMRFDSVFNGLRNIDNKTDIVLIHDCARPFTKTDLINKSIRAADKFTAAIAAVKATSTLKEVSPNYTINETLNRDSIYIAQTPQVFKRELIISAYGKAKKAGFKPTDDSAVVEKFGGRVKIVEGSQTNIKITTKEDMVLAKAILKNKNRISM